MRARRPVGVDETGLVDGMTDTGAGVVRSGKTAFVPGALAGERIRFRRTRAHRQHDEAELLEVLEASAERVQPRCAHFGVCGGCALQHLDAQAQVGLKQRQLADSLDRLARVEPTEWWSALRGPVWGYRRRARLGAKFVTKKGRVLVGFRERAAPYVADLQRCEVLAAPVDALLAPLGALLGALEIRDRVPQIEVAVADNAVALVLRVLAAPTDADIERLREFAAAHGVRFYLQPAGLDSVRPLEPGTDAGTALHYALPDFELRLEMQPTDFVQVNAAVNAALVERAVQLLALDSSSVVLDLFSGIGNFTLAMARRAARVVGVEGDPALVERARHNAALNGLHNVEFHAADLSRPPDGGSPWLALGYTHVLLDPPRAGASAVLSTIARLRPRAVLYISCHPGSFARDIGVLVHEHAMALDGAGVLDMFPHTAHVESIARLLGRQDPKA